MAELASILIPVYNCREWVGHAITSAVEQSWPNKEVIVWDDCSTDGGWEVLQGWRGKVRIERAPRNGGQNVSRNALTGLSRGTWLCYLDADDELLPGAIEEKMKFAGRADAIYGTMEVRHFNGSQITGTRRVEAEPFEDLMAAALQWKLPNTSSFMFRRAALLEAGAWNEEIQNCTDYDLYFKLLLAGKRFAAAKDSFSVYRQWSDEQAVNIDPLRRTTTRLMLMWRTVLELEKLGRITAAVRSSFFNSAMGVVRSIYPMDAHRAEAEHARLRAWAPDVALSGDLFPAPFRLGYRWLGFHGAERLAAMTRFLRPKPATRLFMPLESPP